MFRGILQDYHLHLKKISAKGVRLTERKYVSLYVLRYNYAIKQTQPCIW